MRPLPVLLLGALLRRLLATAVCAGTVEVEWLPELGLGSAWMGEVAAWKPCCVARGREVKEAGREALSAWEVGALPAGREAGCFGGRSAVAEMLSPEGVAEVPARLIAWPLRLVKPVKQQQSTGDRASSNLLPDVLAMMAACGKKRRVPRYITDPGDYLWGLLRCCCRCCCQLPSTGWPKC